MSTLTQFFGGSGTAPVGGAILSNPQSGSGFPATENINLYDVFNNAQGSSQANLYFGQASVSTPNGLQCIAGAYQDLEMVGCMPAVNGEMNFVGFKNLKNINLQPRNWGNSNTIGSWKLIFKPMWQQTGTGVALLETIDGLTLDFGCMYGLGTTSAGSTQSYVYDWVQCNQSTLTSVTNLNLYFQPQAYNNPQGFKIQWDFSGCALDQTSVDLMIMTIADAVTLAAIGTVQSGSLVDVSGGTSSAPSGAVAAATLTLTGKGITVLTN